MAKTYRIYIKVAKMGEPASRATVVELVVSSDVVLVRTVLRQGRIQLEDEKVLWPAVGGQASYLPSWTNIDDYEIDRQCLSRDGSWLMDMWADNYHDILFDYATQQRELALHD